MVAPFIANLLAVPNQGDSLTADVTNLSVQDGDVIFAAIRSQGTTTSDLTPPSGFTRGGTIGCRLAVIEF